MEIHGTLNTPDGQPEPHESSAGDCSSVLSRQLKCGGVWYWGRGEPEFYTVSGVGGTRALPLKLGKVGPLIFDFERGRMDF